MTGAAHTTGSSILSGSAALPVVASAAAKHPAANSSESPGRNGKNTTPVSMNTIRKMNPNVGATPMAIQDAMAARGSLSSRIRKSMNPIISLSNVGCRVPTGSDRPSGGDTIAVQAYRVRPAR